MYIFAIVDVIPTMSLCFPFKSLNLWSFEKNHSYSFVKSFPLQIRKVSELLQRSDKRDYAR